MSPIQVATLSTCYCAFGRRDRRRCFDPYSLPVQSLPPLNLLTSSRDRSPLLPRERNCPSSTLRDIETLQESRSSVDHNVRTIVEVCGLVAVHTFLARLAVDQFKPFHVPPLHPDGTSPRPRQSAPGAFRRWGLKGCTSKAGLDTRPRKPHLRDMRAVGLCFDLTAAIPSARP